VLGKRILAIDPGNAKCGIAVVKEENGKARMVHGEIVETPQLAEALIRIKQEHEFDLIVIGNGTTSRSAQEVVRQALPGRSILIVDEKDTSIRARERYWEHHPRRGWRRLLPSSLQVPPEPVDHYVALILAERALHAE
jgi:RNase H-fold protein (predicted Holliday junction resolvase)